MDQIGPLRQMRERLIEQRRTAVQTGQSAEVMKLQGEIEAVERAIEHEETIEKDAKRKHLYDNL